MKTQTFDSDDVGQIESFVSNLYSRLRIGATGETTRARITRRLLTPEIGFDDLDYSFDIGYAGEPPPTIIICDVVEKTIRRLGEGFDETFGPGEQFLISRPELPYTGVAQSSRLQFTVLDPTLLARVAATDGDQSVRLLDHRPVSAQAGRHLRRCVTHLRGAIASAPEALESPLVVSTAGHYLAASVLNAYPNTAFTAPTRADHHDAHPVTLRRAVAYIEANANADIGLADIATAAHVSARALQYAFRQHLATTPMAYLRRVRLDGAHRDLLAADPSDGDTVTAIAGRWGFLYPSRFAATYRKTYGRHPHTTLHS